MFITIPLEVSHVPFPGLLSHQNLRHLQVVVGVNPLLAGSSKIILAGTHQALHALFEKLLWANKNSQLQYQC